MVKSKVHNLARFFFIHATTPKKRVLLEYEKSYNIVSGLSSVRNYSDLNKNEIPLKNPALISWIISTATTSELMEIIKRYKIPVLQYYSIHELKNRKISVDNLIDYISNEYVTVPSPRCSMEIMRLKDYVLFEIEMGR